jgi:hypothetical protein
MTDFIPTFKDKSRGKGPRSKRQMKKIQRRAILDAKLMFAKPEEEREEKER